MAGDTDTKLDLVSTNKLQVVVVIRYQPSSKAMAAGSMVDGVASGIQSVADQADELMSYLPGVLEEQKQELAPLDDGYIYHQSYPKHWDKMLKETEQNLKEMDSRNEYLLYEYDSTDNLDGDVSKLQAKIQHVIAPLSSQIYGIHFLGLDGGGNIAVAVAQKIKSSLGEGGSIDSIFCVGTALYGTDQTKTFLGGVPNVASYNSTFDLSAHALSFAQKPDAIIDLIKQANQTPIKYMYNMLILKITKLLTQLLQGLMLDSSSGLDPAKKLINSLKSDIESIIESLVKFVKHLIDSFKQFLSLPDIDQKLDEVFGHPGTVAEDSAARLMKFFKTITDIFNDGEGDEKNKNGKGVGLNTDAIKIGNLFNFLVPPVLLIDNALNAVTISLDKNESANNLGDFTKKDAFHQPISGFDKQIATKDPYQQSVLKAAEDKDLDQLTSMVATVRQNVATLASPDTENNRREEIGVSLSRSLLLPMLSSKTEILAKLRDLLPSLASDSFLSAIKSDTVTAPLLSLLRRVKGNIELDSTDNGNDKELGLKKALERLDGSLEKIKGIFMPNYFKIDKKYNSLHFIYNSHNIALAQMPKELRKGLDKATNIYQTKLAQGFEYDELDGSYKPGKGGVKTADVLVVEKAA